ncbi:hypothetical protein C3941_09155 [Kaistia algarum]|nr:hypothetical protein [Kaistia algarum]MCX5512228.1 hypothetical protein [Kaistia algarum]PPE80322.1 hypothetical protein C3941_09155 [Kaistia algarum]
MAMIETSTVGTPESPRSAVSWGAIIAGAVVAAAVSLVMLLLGSGLGLAAVSPWSGAGAAATTFAVSAVIWFVATQWVASAFGGYITGRLRTKWTNLNGDEVFFRDTAHGFITWCFATLIVAAAFSSTLAGIVSQGAQSGAAIVAGAAQGATQGAVQSSSLTDPTGYLVDTMFRPATPSATSAAGDAEARGEATRILVNGLANGEVPAADKEYLASLIASRTGISPADATKRIDDGLAQIEAAKQKAKEAADAARKVALTTALLTVAALLVGAFISGVAAAFGGRQRDDDAPVIATARVA